MYEWNTQTLDFYEGCGSDPDIIENWFCDTYAEAVSQSESFDEPTRIVLERFIGNDEEGIIDRTDATLELCENGVKLPDWTVDCFGVEIAKVPQKFHREVASFHKQNSK
tara:strand:- start:369 stop:695 length:327 start_codon:yes stop_codon:yes gene_type:complete